MTGEKDFFCSDLAQEHNVPLVGTATQGDLWFLLEYAGPWGAKAFEESEIPAEVKKYILSATHPEVSTRILLVRQGDSHQREGISFFIGQTYPHNPRLYQYHLNHYVDILDINLSSLVAGEPGDPAHLREQPLFLVCTNGRRDKCCARYGPAVYQAMAEQAGDAVWQSSHVAGHNQAPISLFFPDGVNYGDMTPEEACSLMRHYQQGQVILRNYRGRVCYPPHVQAAEYFWRQQIGVLDLPGMQVKSVSELGDNQWAVEIEGMDGQNTNCVRLERRFSDYKIPITCTKKKESAIVSFHMLERS